MKQNNIIISIEGNIGSGKSTLLANLQEYFKDYKKIIFLKEPVDEWESITDKNGTSMLKLFYQDQKQHSFSFQMMALITRMKLLKEAIKNNPDSIIITERSLYTDKMVFAKMLYDSKNIEIQNYKIYLNLFEIFAFDYKIDHIIYVNTSPEICYERIAKRSRDGESNISLEYLTKCHEYHNEMLSDVSLFKDQWIYDGNVELDENKTNFDILIGKIIGIGFTNKVKDILIF
jgi:deoxyadenosine/deoxycytidine kinase